MMGDMDDLVQFIRDRYDDGAAAARGCGQPSMSWQNFDMDGELRDDVNAGTVAVVPREETRAHIARHDPAHTLRRIEAQRELVKLHGSATLRAGGGAQHFATETVCRSCEPNYQFPEQSWPCPTLRLLALPYADHPDYKEKWRP